MCVSKKLADKLTVSFCGVSWKPVILIRISDTGCRCEQVCDPTIYHIYCYSLSIYMYVPLRLLLNTATLHLPQAVTVENRMHVENRTHTVLLYNTAWSTGTAALTASVVHSAQLAVPLQSPVLLDTYTCTVVKFSSPARRSSR